MTNKKHKKNHKSMLRMHGGRPSLKGSRVSLEGMANNFQCDGTEN
jgi:hypothetical protein